MSTDPRTESLDGLVHELTGDAGEARLMKSALALLAYAAPLEPSPSLRERVLARLVTDDRGAVFEAEDSYFARAAQLPWVPIAPGVEVKVLYRDRASGAQTTLVRMGPNLPFPPHGHDHIEDLYLVEGTAFVGEIAMRAGDYCRAPAGTEHNTVRSGDRGSLAVVVSR